MVGEKKDERREIGEMCFWEKRARKGDRVQNEASASSILFPTLMLWVQILGGEE
jgi:hypothetical protein